MTTRALALCPVMIVLTCNLNRLTRLRWHHLETGSSRQGAVKERRTQTRSTCLVRHRASFSLLLSDSSLISYRCCRLLSEFDSVPPSTIASNLAPTNPESWSLCSGGWPFNCADYMGPISNTTCTAAHPYHGAHCNQTNKSTSWD